MRIRPLFVRRSASTQVRCPCESGAHDCHDRRSGRNGKEHRRGVWRSGSAFSFLDTGAMYRVVALRCLEQAANPESDEASGALARSAEITFEDCRTFLGAGTSRQLIRETNVTQAASLVARNPSVRSAMVGLQRAFATGRDIVTEGRDQGTVVFPGGAQALSDGGSRGTGPAAVRRAAPRGSRSRSKSFSSSRTRAISGTRRGRRSSARPDDAVVIDTTSLSIEQVLERMLELVAARRSR